MIIIDIQKIVYQIISKYVFTSKNQHVFNNYDGCRGNGGDYLKCFVTLHDSNH